MGGRPVEFRILGPLEVADEDGRAVELGGPKPRALLAILLLHENEVVPVARLVDDLWGERPPEGAAKAVQISVSRLRKALGASADVLQTRPGGYTVRLDEGSLDLRRFERLEREGRRALAAGDAEDAAARLGEALELWRGPPLAEFAEGAFGHEVARLAERRLAAVEERVDAELALGRHAALVPELGQLVEEHPYRERLRGQLMLALARSGRQADALRVYDEGRRRLVEELGIEPGGQLRELQVGVLRQDPAVVEGPRPAAPAAVEAPPAAPPAAAPPAEARRRRLPAAAVAGLLLAAAAAVAVLAIVRPGSGGGAVGENVVAVLDARDGSPAGTVDVGERPGLVTAGLGAVWVASARDGTVSRLDPATRRRGRTFGLGFAPTGLAAGENAVWAADGRRGRLVRLNPVTGERRELDVGRGGRAPVSVAVGGGSVWVANANEFAVLRIDPRENRVVARIDVDSPRLVAGGEEGVWVVAATGVVELDPVANEVGSTWAVGFAPGGLALGGGSVWISRPRDDTVWRYDAATQSFSRTIDVGAGPRALAFGSGSLWVSTPLDGSVSRVDPGSNEEVDVVRLGGRPAGVAVAGGHVWVAVAPR